MYMSLGEKDVVYFCINHFRNNKKSIIYDFFLPTIYLLPIFVNSISIHSTIIMIIWQIENFFVLHLK